jgi:hypothetical protein
MALLHEILAADDVDALKAYPQVKSLGADIVWLACYYTSIKCAKWTLDNIVLKVFYNTSYHAISSGCWQILELLLQYYNKEVNTADNMDYAIQFADWEDDGVIQTSNHNKCVLLLLQYGGYIPYKCAWATSLGDNVKRSQRACIDAMAALIIVMRKNRVPKDLTIHVVKQLFAKHRLGDEWL